MAFDEPKSICSHWGSLNCDDQRVLTLPSTALSASRPAFSTDDALATPEISWPVADWSLPGTSLSMSAGRTHAGSAAAASSNEQAAVMARRRNSVMVPFACARHAPPAGGPAGGEFPPFRPPERVVPGGPSPQLGGPG